MAKTIIKIWFTIFVFIVTDQMDFSEENTNFNAHTREEQVTLLLSLHLTFKSVKLFFFFLFFHPTGILPEKKSKFKKTEHLSISNQRWEKIKYVVQTTCLNCRDTHTHTPREREQYPSTQLVWWPCHCVCVCVCFKRERAAVGSVGDSVAFRLSDRAHHAPPPHRPLNNTTLASSGFFFRGGGIHHYSTVIVGPWNVLKPETKCVWRRVSSVGTRFSSCCCVTF